jgi:AraC-like DNA-binding protein
MQPYWYLSIHPALREIITFIGAMDVDFNSSELSPIYQFPWTSNTHLFFPLCDEPLLVKSGDEKVYRSYTSAYFVGPKLVNDIVNFGTRIHVIGITFKPGAFQRLTGIPATHLTNNDFTAQSIFGNEILEIEIRLREAKGDKARLAIIENFLLKRISKIQDATPFDKAIDELLKESGNLTVETFANYACKSTRQLERASFEKLGMSPKLFARLTRFSKAFALKEANPDFNWTSIAHQLGYYDQMHLIKDFKTFTGTTPSLFNDRTTHSTKIMAVLEGVY